MVTKTVFGLPTLGIRVEQAGGRKKLFNVIYGQQVSAYLPYNRAAEELGRCIFHSLACLGNLKNDGE